MVRRIISRCVVLCAAFLGVLGAAFQPVACGDPPKLRAMATRSNLEIQAAEEVVVRVKHAPRQFDEKGKPISPTAAQLKELRGDPKLPGYNADFSDLKNGQVVTIYLGRRKQVKESNTTDKEKAKSTEKTHWTPIGQLTGRLVKVEGPNAADGKGKAKKNDELARDATAKLTIEIDSVALARAGQRAPGSAGKATLGQDVSATMVMIVVDSGADKDSARK